MVLFILGTTTTACTLACIYVVLCLYTLYQFLKIVHYRHSLNSFHVLFLWTVFSWSSLRVVYWMSRENQYSCSSEVLHALPYALQFSTFSLVLFFIINVMYGHHWQNTLHLFVPKPRQSPMRLSAAQQTYGTTTGYADDDFHDYNRGTDAESDTQYGADSHRYLDETDAGERAQYLICRLPFRQGACFNWKMRIRTFHVFVWIGVNVVMTFMVTCLTMARCQEVIDVSYSVFDRFMTLFIFSFLLFPLVIYGWKFSQQAHEPHTRNAEMRSKIGRLVVFIGLTCITRCAYAILYPWLPQQFLEMEIMDNGAKHPQLYLVCAEILWEILPAAAVFVFFGGVPKTSHPRSLFRPFLHFWDRSKSSDPSSPPLAPGQETSRFRDTVGHPGVGLSVSSSVVGGIYAPYLQSISSYTHSHYVHGSLTASAHNYRTIFDDPHRYESDPPDSRHGNILHAPTGASVTNLLGGVVGSNLGAPFDLLETHMPPVYSTVFTNLPPSTAGPPATSGMATTGKAARDVHLHTNLVPDLFPGADLN
eukprot:GGOE01003648.1.p1 GENE.GGOE01003648.1~~GGOE01003648.1.p1  ORF type:complete len:533 (+),score=57.96 GGOE01003648.1:33-1631(+)